MLLQKSEELLPCQKGGLLQNSCWSLSLSQQHSYSTQSNVPDDGWPGVAWKPKMTS
jgi:hypothetical protein